MTFLLIGILLLTSSITGTTTPTGMATAATTTITTGSFKISDYMKQIIQSRIDNAGSNAAIVVGLVNSSGTQFYGYGKLSSSSSNKTTVDKNTIFDIGSITKTFTTTLLADMVDHGIVNLNDPIQKYLPATVKAPTFNNNDRQQPQQITLKDLATHTSGLPDYPANWPLYGVASEKYTIQQMYQALSSVKLTRPPGTEYNYSDFGMGLLGDILASKSGIPYEQLVINKILNPLGMNSTRITLSDTLRSRLATGHFNGQEVNPLLDLPPALAAGGAFRSSASDMVNYLSANIGLTKTSLYNAMQESHMSRLNTNQTGVPGYKVYVGLGWFTTTATTATTTTAAKATNTSNNNNNNFNNDTIIWHNGIFNGYNSFIGFNPIKQRGIIILCSGVQQPYLTLISQIGFGRFDNLSSLIWNLLNR